MLIQQIQDKIDIGTREETPIAKAEEAVLDLEQKYADKFQVNPDLSRSLVSFQANKSEPIIKWFKYREGFSKDLVKYIIDKLSVGSEGIFLDPFAGSGVSVFTAEEVGYESIGIELLPVGSLVMKTRKILSTISKDQLLIWAHELVDDKPWKRHSGKKPLEHLAITAGAFPNETEESIAQYRSWLNGLSTQKSAFCNLVLFSILEEISYTRKDGQYLRWDNRAARDKLRSKFCKDEILSFDEGVDKKCLYIIEDLNELNLFGEDTRLNGERIEILEGSVFQEINSLSDNLIDLSITSPPYCNRYDYTRTYALEMAYQDVDEEGIRWYRQQMLSCTVENKPKQFKGLVDDVHIATAERVFARNKCINEILSFLEREAREGNLNNNAIVRMVRGYFWETALHLSQMHQKLKKGGYYVMVNDNVRYAGLDIPVDCILSDFAESIGFYCEKIWVLPKGKGNSSQQMGKHGRKEMRKCVYIWKKL